MTWLIALLALNIGFLLGAWWATAHQPVGGDKPWTGMPARTPSQPAEIASS